MRRTPSYPLTSAPWRLRVAEAQPLQSDAVPETSYPSRWSAFSCIARSVPSGQLFHEEVSECENGRGFREGCPCEDRFVGVMERRRGPCDAVELDDELFGRHRDAGAARRRQTELQVVSVLRRIEARGSGWRASVRDARDTRETQHIAPVAYQAGSSCRHTKPLRRTASGTVTCIRGMWGRR